MLKRINYNYNYLYYDILNYAWFAINKQGIEDRITFIKLMIDLVNKKIEQENN